MASAGEHPVVEPEERLMVGVIEAPGAQLEDVPASWGWDPQRWRERQEDDEGLVVLRTYLERGILPGAAEMHAQTQMVRKLLGHWKRLCLRDGVVCRTTQDPTTRETVCQVVVPEAQIRSLLQAYHGQLGHQGKKRTVSLLRRHFYWVRMDASVGLYVQECPRCTLFKARREVRAPLVPVRPRAPLHMVAMDFLTFARWIGIKISW